MGTSVEIEVVCRTRNLQGECPVWNAAEQALYWIDTRKPALLRVDRAGRLDAWDMPRPIGSIAFRHAGGLVAAMQNGFCTIDLPDPPDSAAPPRVTPIIDPEPHRPDNRMNDGRCDRLGRFWCGSRDSDASGNVAVNPTGSIYRLDADFRCSTADRDYIIPNGMAFSPDDRTMLLADSGREILYAYDFDLAAGTIGNRRDFFSTRDMAGRVDGATCDADGCYWFALINGWSIVRLDPAGRIDRVIELPVRRPSMCCFGGPDLDVLYVTTSSINLTDAEVAAQPLAGMLLAVRGLGTRGVPEPWFAG
ncbi:MAG: SMP-30/gluconolactonase/LRE family protein [Lautropia sp.]